MKNLTLAGMILFFGISVLGPKASLAAFEIEKAETGCHYMSKKERDLLGITGENHCAKKSVSHTDLSSTPASKR